MDNRLREIRGVTGVEYNYLPTTENPADLGTRGITLHEFTNSRIPWMSGPSWQNENRESWPVVEKFNLSPEDVENIQLGQCKMDKLYEISLPLQEGARANCSDGTPYDMLERNYSSLDKLYRVTAYCTRFIDKIRKKPVASGPIKREEYRNSRYAWEKAIQRRAFPAIFEAIRTNSKNDLKEKLGIEIDSQGLLRAHGRFINISMCSDTNYPKLLPRNDSYTSLVIRHMHERLLHSGIAHTLSQIRSEYWIIHGRREVFKVIRKCGICQKNEGGAYKMPPMPSWPISRVKESAPFSFTGLDYIGPLYIKQGTQLSKVWICLFTCMAVRAIHLELVADLSAKEFFLCLKRFISRRGKPTEVLLDNAPQFKLVKKTADYLWSKCTHDDSIQSYVARQGILWKFIPEFSPWMGGFYERLVGLVKRSIRKAIGKVTLSYVQLETLAIEIEGILNSRPLVYVGSDLESGMAITPAHFLSLNPKIGVAGVDDISDPDYTPNFSSVHHLLESWKKGQEHLKLFWNHWRTEYLTSLRERYQKSLRIKGKKSQQNPRNGDVILIKEEGQPRGSWKIGKIVDLRKSEDGLIRKALVKLSTGKTITRALSYLYPLELPSQTAGLDRTEILPQEIYNESFKQQQNERGIRASAKAARKCIEDQLKSDSDDS